MLRIFITIAHYMAVITLYGILMILLGMLIEHQNIDSQVAQAFLYVGMGVLAGYPAIWLFKQPDKIVNGGSKLEIAEKDRDYWKKQFDEYSNMYIKEAQRAVELQRKLDKYNSDRQW